MRSDFSQAIHLNFVLGTRPEGVKLALPILLARKDPRFRVSTVSTGQHRELLRPILEFFDIQPEVDLDLMRPGQDLTDVMTEAMRRLRDVWKQQRPDVVCIQGDTITCAAAAAAAFLEGIPLAHVEAGLRTHDIRSPFPEEYSRRLVALGAEWNFAPTEGARANLLREGVPEGRVWVTGNTGIDALLEARRRLASEEAITGPAADLVATVREAKALGKKIVLLTTHRRESFGEPLRESLGAVRELANREDLLIVFPVHKNPAVRAAVDQILGEDGRILRTEPLDYVPFVALMAESDLILTDSGGVQEEAPSLGVPVLVLRENTERAESVEAGTALLVGTNRARILREAEALLDNPVRRAAMRAIRNPYGDGQATARILDILAGARSAPKG